MWLSGVGRNPACIGRTDTFPIHRRWSIRYRDRLVRAHFNLLTFISAQIVGKFGKNFLTAIRDPAVRYINLLIGRPNPSCGQKGWQPCPIDGRAVWPRFVIRDWHTVAVTYRRWT